MARQKYLKAVSYERVRELFDYDVDGGFLISKGIRGGREVAGPLVAPNDRGYKVIGIDGKTYRAHRIIWLWNYGYLPENGLDHIDRNKENNRLDNLREVSKRCNSINSCTNKNNKSGVRGVSWNSKIKKWYSTIAINKINKFLGAYDSILEAACARLAAEQCLEWETCATSSAALYVNTNTSKVELNDTN